jgi:alanyl-tRNA synthetase
MVVVPGVSIELCGGTHVRHTGEIGLFRIVSESGIAAGIRRIEAVTGTGAYRRAVEREELLESVAEALRTSPDALASRVSQLNDENRELKRQLQRARTSGGGDLVTQLIEGATAVDGARVIAREIDAESPDELRVLGDRLREKLGSGAAVLAARQNERVTLMAIVTDDLLSRGVHAGRLVHQIAALTGGSGGGRPHMAQGGAGDPAQLPGALDRAPEIVRSMLAPRH